VALNPFLKVSLDALAPRGRILTDSIHPHDARHIVAAVDQWHVRAVEAGGELEAAGGAEIAVKAWDEVEVDPAGTGLCPLRLKTRD